LTQRWNLSNRGVADGDGGAPSRNWRCCRRGGSDPGELRWPDETDTISRCPRTQAHRRTCTHRPPSHSGI